MRAIETHYNGFVFRSRTEARWAVAFDEAELEYDYESQGYNLRGTPYLPDFWLPQVGWWVEIKGGPPSHAEQRLARLLMLESGCSAYIFCGAPATVGNGSFPVWTYPALGSPTENERGQRILDELARLLAIQELGIDPIVDSPREADGYLATYWKRLGWLDHGLAAGRGARFEHGEKGAGQWAKRLQSSIA